ncbi:MAG: hypothetical protein LBE09_00625 [Christensenellaceae bacterium]|jgi:hypothetical protein|nr:hypothetical protein [Christensenellaceae bacterium]
MKKTTYIILIILVCSLFAFYLTSCTTKNFIVGTWVLDTDYPVVGGGTEGIKKITLYKDGTFLANEEDEGTWKYQPKDKRWYLTTGTYFERIKNTNKVTMKDISSAEFSAWHADTILNVFYRD